jgi:hypothetical protein
MRVGCLLILLAVAAAPVAACPLPPAASPLEPGEFGLFFDPQGTVTCLEVPPFTPFTVYAVARAPEGGMEAWTVPSGLDVDPDALQLLDVRVGDDVIEVQIADFCGVVHSADPSTCLIEEGGIVVLYALEMMRLDASPSVCPAGLLCSLFAGPTPAPQYYAPCGTLSEDPHWTAGEDLLVPHAPFCLGFEATIAAEEQGLGPWKARW